MQEYAILRRIKMLIEKDRQRKINYPKSKTKSEIGRLTLGRLE